MMKIKIKMILVQMNALNLLMKIRFLYEKHFSLDRSLYLQLVFL